MNRLRILMVGLAVAVGGGCTSGCKQAAVSVPEPEESPRLPTAAQPKLQTLKLWLGSEEMEAELALTHDQVQTGMMFRKQMAENEGMLFVFPIPHRASFWMRNTLIPMTCAYLDSAGAILEIRDMKPLDETPIQAGSDEVQFVLEMPQGWFERNKIAVGTVVRTEAGSLSETYFRK